MIEEEEELARNKPPEIVTAKPWEPPPKTKLVIKAICMLGDSEFWFKFTLLRFY